MDRTIKVRGTGKASQSPDQVKIEMTISAHRLNYNEALQELNQRTTLLKNDLAKIGFKKEDVKTTNFNVETVYRYEDNKRIFDGYKATHDLRLTFDLDKELLNQTLMVLSTTKARPTFDVRFTIKDQQAFKNKILENALINARESAKVIASTLGVELGDIVEVNYDFNNRIYESNLNIAQDLYVAQDAMIDIDPEDVEQTETVSVWWDVRNVY